MRARFASDVVFAESCEKIEPETEPLEARIDDFKRDSQNMEVVEEFVDDVLQKAEKEAVKKQGAEGAAAAAKSNGNASQQTKEKLGQNFKNGKVVNRARGLVVRIFDAICNCANSAAGPAQRIKLRGKRAAAAAAAATANKEGNAENNEEIRPEKQQLEQERVNKSESKQPQVVIGDAGEEMPK